MSRPSGGDTPVVKSAERVLLLVEQLIRAPQPLSVQDLQRALPIPRSSMHALLATMIRTGWATQRESRYSPGPVARLLGSTRLDEIDIVEVASDVLSRLRDEVGETVHLATLEGSDVLYLASRFSPHALGVRFQPGRRLPAQITALGKAMLAACPEDLLAAHLPQEYVTPTPKSVRSQEELLRSLEETRERGYGIDDEETAVGLRCFAVALIIPGLAPHALSCSTPVARLDPPREEEIIAALKQAHDEIVRHLAA